MVLRNPNATLYRIFCMLIIIHYILSEALFLLLRFICVTGPPIFARLVQLLHSIAVLNII